MRTYKLAHGAITATGNNQAYVSIARPGVIRSVTWSVAADIAADNVVVELELSVNPVSQIGTNDTIGSLSEVKITNNLVTSGMVASGVHVLDLVNCPVMAGERLYINAVITGATSVKVTCFVRVEER